ncbi:MAG TPA: hypothetical protein VGK73_21200, partial [Polyangiaceae bacterium]
ALPWVLVAILVVLGGAGAGVLLLRSKSSDAAASAAPVETITPSLPSAAVSVPANTAPSIAPPPSGPIEAKAPVVVQRTSPPPEPHVAEKPKAAPARPPAPPPAPATPSANGAAKSARCFSDPFSGQIRPAGSGRAPDAQTFPCKQDPFTGKFKRL